MLDTLVHDGAVGTGTSRVPSPFLIDSEALSRPCRHVDARLKWRNSVFAVARKMLTEDGHRHFTLRRLSIQTNTSVQNIYNNIGAKDDVILQAMINYNRILLDLFGNDSYNSYINLINARHKEVSEYPEYARAVHATIFDNTYINESMRTETMRLLTPFARYLVRSGAKSIDYVRLSKLLATTARGAAREWFDGMCSADEMRNNSLADGEICVAGALFRAHAHEWDFQEV